MNNKRPVLKLNLAVANVENITKPKPAKEEKVPATETFITATEKDRIPTGTNTKPITSTENMALGQQDRKPREQKPKDKPKLLMAPDEYTSMLDFFKESYPKCFTEDPTPLAIDIHKRIYALHKERFSRVSLKKFLTVYCRSQYYRQAHIVGAGRVDLSGNIVSLVTEEQALRKRWKKAAKATAGLRNSKPHKGETALKASAS